MRTLEERFDAAMMSIYHEAKKIGYTPSMFHQMVVKQGGLAAAKQLINAPNPSDGYTKLWELGRLDISVEVVVLENDNWHPLFTQEELGICRKRLTDYGYLS